MNRNSRKKLILASADLLRSPGLAKGQSPVRFQRADHLEAPRISAHLDQALEMVTLKQYTILTITQWWMGVNRPQG